MNATSGWYLAQGSAAVDVAEALDTDILGTGAGWAVGSSRTHAAVVRRVCGGLVAHVYGTPALDPPSALKRLGVSAVADGADALGPWRAGRRVRLRVDWIVARQQVGDRTLMIVDTEGFGRVLLVDGAIHATSYDEDTRHEALVVPSQMAAPAARRVLIAGFAGGALARRALAAWPAARVAVCVASPVEVELAQRWLGSWHGHCFDDPRLTVFVGGPPVSEPWDVVLVEDPGRWHAAVPRGQAGCVVAAITGLADDPSSEARLEAMQGRVGPMLRYRVPFASAGGTVLYGINRPPEGPEPSGTWWGPGTWAAVSRTAGARSWSR